MDLAGVLRDPLGADWLEHQVGRAGGRHGDWSRSSVLEKSTKQVTGQYFQCAIVVSGYPRPIKGTSLNDFIVLAMSARSAARGLAWR